MLWRKPSSGTAKPSPVSRWQEACVYLLILGTLGLIANTDGLPMLTLGMCLTVMIARMAGVTLSTNLGCALLVSVGAGAPLYWFFFHSFAGLNVKDFLLAVLMVFLLSAQNGRDFAAVSSYAVWIMLASLFPSSGPQQWVFLGILFGWFLVVQSMNELRRSWERADRWSRSSGSQAVLGVMGLMVVVLLGVGVLAGGLYLVLPRNPIAAFHLNFQPFRNMVGFSNSVRLGQIGELQMDRTPAFRVKFLQGAPPPSLRFRGVALADFNGTTWSNNLEAWRAMPLGSKIITASDEQRRLPGTRVFYEVQTLASMDRVVFSAGVPEYVFLPEGRLRMNGEGALRQVGTEQRLPSYSLSAWVDPKPHWGAHGIASDATATMSPERLKRYTKLPYVHPRIRELAQSLTGSRTDPMEAAALLENFLLNNFTYSLKNSIGGREPLLDFLFFTRAGHCEYFASALAVMLRSLSLPARVVTGFNANMTDPVDGWYVVRSYNAHSWVEVWVDGKGWVTFDPTPPGSNEAPVSALGRWMERMQNRFLVWSEEWVGGMGRLRRPKLPDVRELAWLLLLPVLGGLVWMAWKWRPAKRVKKNPAAEIYERYLAGQKVEWKAGQTARGVEKLAGDAEAMAIREAYERARYGKGGEGVKELEELVEAVGKKA